MRRRIRSAAFPVHRHSVPQLLVDGILVALAYYLAFRLRFESGFGGANDRYGDLLTHTIFWVVPVALAVLAAFGQYQRLWTFVGQRDYEAVVKGVIVATLVIVGAIAFLHPVTTTADSQTTPVNLPGSVIALFLLLALALLIGARFLVHLVIEGRVRSFRAAKGARDVLIVGGGDGGRLVVRELIRNPQLRLRPVGFVDDDPRKLGMKDEHGLKVLGTTDSEDLARVLDEVEPDEVVIAIPSAPGTLRAPRGGRLPRAWHPGADDPDRVRAAQGLNRAAERHPPAARGAGRGHARARARADGDRAGRRVPVGPGRDGDRRRRLDRLRAVPPDRPRRARDRSFWSTTPRTTCSRSCASSRRIATSGRLFRCWPIAGKRSGCAKFSRSTGRASSSMRPPTST